MTWAQSARSRLNETWAMQLDKIELLEDVSAGAVRSLAAHATADTQETIETIEDAEANAIGSSAALADAWLSFAPRYVQRETERLLPELRKRWPTKPERKERKAERQRRERWCEDGANIVLVLGGAWQHRVTVRFQAGLRERRFERLVDALAKVGAIRVDGLRLLAIAPSHWAREALAREENVTLSTSI